MLYALLMTVSTAAVALSVYSVLRISSARRRRLPAAGQVEPVTVLKPLCGADDALESNLETFFLQTYADYELVFGVEGEDDPAAAVVRRLRERHPQVRCRLVIHDGGRALNPKISNLRAMLEAGAHDIVLISDSNVDATPGYVEEMVGHLLDRAQDGRPVGLVTSLFAGVGERTLGAALENLHLTGTIAGAVATSQEMSGRTVTVGKSMMFRQSVLERLGGFESVATMLAEDYVLGRMFRAAGYEVRLASEIVRNVCARTTVKAFLRRQLRWGLLRSRLKPLAYPFEPLVSPLFVGLLAPLFGVHSWAPLLWGLALTVVRDVVLWWRLRGPRGLALVLPLGPVKELLAVGVWAVAPFHRHVSWRGRRFRVSAGTRLYAEVPMNEPAELRTEEATAA